MVELHADSITFIESDGEYVEVNDAGNGHLQCSSDRTYWCDHIQRVVTEGWDSRFITNLLDKDETWAVEYVNLEVPMIPSQNIWLSAQLHATKAVGGIPMFGVEVQTQFSIDPEFLGFIGEGEGRDTLRVMALNFLTGRPEFENSVCSSSMHSMSAQRQWRLDMDGDNRTRQFMQHYSVFTENKCLKCLGSSGDMSDMADLVPDDRSPSGNQSPWSRQ